MQCQRHCVYSKSSEKFLLTNLLTMVRVIRNKGNVKEHNTRINGKVNSFPFGKRIFSCSIGLLGVKNERRK